MLTLLEGDLSNFSFCEAHFRTPLPDNYCTVPYYRISILQNSILIDPTLETSKLSMLEISLFAVFSYCTFKLAIKMIDKSIIMFWDYPQRGTQGYRFGFSVVTSLLVVESITRQ